jgi:ketosteroid isomerase-like protein
VGDKFPNMDTTLTKTNIDLINEIYAAFGRGDVQAILDRLTDDCLWITHLEECVPWAGDYSGKATVPGFFSAIFDSVDVLGFQPTEFISEGDTVVSLGTFACRSKATGKSTETRWIFVWKVRNGLVCSYEQFHDPRLAQAFTV